MINYTYKVAKQLFVKVSFKDFAFLFEIFAVHIENAKENNNVSFSGSVFLSMYICIDHMDYKNLSM